MDAHPAVAALASLVEVTTAFEEIGRKLVDDGGVPYADQFPSYFMRQGTAIDDGFAMGKGSDFFIDWYSEALFSDDRAAVFQMSLCRREPSDGPGWWTVDAEVQSTPDSDSVLALPEAHVQGVGGMVALMETTARYLVENYDRAMIAFRSGKELFGSLEGLLPEQVRSCTDAEDRETAALLSAVVAVHELVTDTALDGRMRAEPGNLGQRRLVMAPIATTSSGNEAGWRLSYSVSAEFTNGLRSRIRVDLAATNEGWTVTGRSQQAGAHGQWETVIESTSTLSGPSEAAAKLRAVTAQVCADFAAAVPRLRASDLLDRLDQLTERLDTPRWVNQAQHAMRELRALTVQARSERRSKLDPNEYLPHVAAFKDAAHAGRTHTYERSQKQIYYPVAFAITSFQDDYLRFAYDLTVPFDG